MPARRRRGTLGAVPDAPRRAVLYIRVSALMGRVEGSEEFHSPDMQRAAMERHITPLGMRVVDTVADIDVSGQTFNRAGLDRIRELASAHAIDAVAIYDLSRLGRDVAESLTFIRWLRDRGVTVISTKERIDDSTQGQFMLGQFLLLAELYGRQIGDRWAEIIERRATLGHHHGPPPLGYTKDDRLMVPDPILGAAVTEVFNRYAAGHTIAEITRGFSERRGRLTQGVNIKRMLGNPVYRGKVVHHGQVADGLHEPLVDQATWDTVQTRLDRDRRTVTKHLAPSYSLGGLVYCGASEHDHHLSRHDDVDQRKRWAHVPWRDRPKVQRLRCGYRANNRGAGCWGIGSPTLSDLEDLVLARIKAFLGDLQADHTAIAEKTARKTRAGVDQARLTRELARTRDALGRLATEWALRDLTDEEFQAARESLRRVERGLVAQLDAVSDVAASLSPARTIKAIETLLRLWPDATIPERNRMLRAVIRRVTVYRATRYHEPLDGRVVCEFL